MNSSISNNSSFLPDIQIIDLGVKIPAAWSAGKKLIETIIDGLGDVNFGELYVNGYALPSLDIYFDDPKKVKLPLSKSINGNESYLYENAKLIYSEVSETPSINEVEKIAAAFNCDAKDLKFIVTSPTSLISSIYGSFLSAPILMDKLLKYGLKEEEILWSWSTTTLPALTDDKQILGERMQSALAYGTVISFWVRTNDKKIEEILSRINLCGQLRIHNLQSAKTFVHGSLDLDKLQESFNICVK
jgi:methenyltetrahydromethanopterin cyclohydrolase